MLHLFPVTSVQMRVHDHTGCINYGRMQVSKISGKSLILKNTLFPASLPILNWLKNIKQGQRMWSVLGGVSGEEKTLAELLHCVYLQISMRFYSITSKQKVKCWSWSILCHFVTVLLLWFTCITTPNPWSWPWMLLTKNILKNIKGTPWKHIGP